ncbi:MAG: alpha/beta hydrolase [Steroidobacteraceae bacterium]|jgi:alpha/beta superfamily hydrolase
MTPAGPAQRLTIAGPAGSIEAVVEDPQTPAAHGSRPGAFAIVCHPHPLFGGTMDNKVVTTLARALQACAVPTVRFNFRGVGLSAGAFDEGVGETEDLAAVAGWADRRWPGRQLIAAGFSFGAYVAMRMSARRALAALITVAPPVTRFDFSQISAPSCLWLIVQGDADEVVDPNAVADWAKSLAPPPHLVMLPGVGHFFHGHLSELRDTVIREIRSG